MSDYVPRFTNVYDRMIEAAIQRPRYILSEGGTRSGKTFAALQMFYFLVNKDKTPSVNSVVSETFPHLKRGAIRDFQSIFGDAWDESRWSKSESIYTCVNGSIIEFFSADAPAKVHGPARKRLFVNEIQNIPYEIARQLFVRTQGLIILDYNPTHMFWAQEKIEPSDKCIKIHSTYKDNKFLTLEQIAEIESNKNDNSWWTVYGEGKVGQMDGLIYNFEQIGAMPDKSDKLKEVYGLDFGFSNDPTAIVRLLVDMGRKIIYVDERCYKTRMLNSDIVEMLKSDNISKATEIFADCAEPKSIADIGKSGLNIRACDKDAPVKSGKMVFQIQWLKGWQIFVTKRSVNVIKELRNYTWAKDRDGNLLNEPIDKWNHALDAIRYGMWSKFGSKSSGNYSYSVIR